MRWAGNVARIGKIRNLYNTLVENPEGRKPFGRPRRTREVNVRMDIMEI
jgi:hypothetical protein